MNLYAACWSPFAALPFRDVIASAGTSILLSSTLVYQFCSHGQLLGHLAGVRKFLSAFFHWKGTLGLGVREGLLFMRVCFCPSIKDRQSVRGSKRDRKSETKSCSSLFVCLIHVSMCVCLLARGDRAGVRDSDGVERVWCTVITLSGMWLSWELLALGTWVNKLLFKGQLPSLYRLLSSPPLCTPHPVSLYLISLTVQYVTVRQNSIHILKLWLKVESVALFVAACKHNVHIRSHQKYCSVYKY